MKLNPADIVSLVNNRRNFKVVYLAWRLLWAWLCGLFGLTEHSTTARSFLREDNRNKEANTRMYYPL